MVIAIFESIANVSHPPTKVTQMILVIQANNPLSNYTCYGNLSWVTVVNDDSNPPVSAQLLQLITLSRYGTDDLRLCFLGYFPVYQYTSIHAMYTL